MVEMFWPRLRNRMANSAEIIDDHEGIDIQLFTDHRPADDPRVVGELNDISINGPCNGDGGCARKRRAVHPLKFLPCGLKTGMLCCLQRYRITQFNHLARIHFCKGKARVGSADIDGDNRGHSPAAASMADPPFSASSAVARIIANSSRPVPMCATGVGAGVRPAHSLSSTSTDNVPLVAHRRTTSPS